MSELKPESENQQLVITDEEDGIARDSKRKNPVFKIIINIALYVENP